MSYSDRASHNANSAIIVTVTPQDFPGDGPLAGVEFQRQLEEKAYKAGKGKVPVQYYEDFKENRSSEPEENRIKPCIKGQYEYASLRGIFPEECEKAFIEGMEHFDILFQNLQEKMSYWLAWRAEPLPRYAYTEMKRFRVRDYRGCIHVEKALATQAALLQRLWMECMWQNRLPAAFPYCIIKKHALQ